MRKNNLRYESERDRLVTLRTKVDKDAAEAVQAWAEIWQCTEYAAVRTLIYAGLGRAIKECECDPILYTRTKNACKKGTPSARDRGNAAKESKEPTRGDVPW